MGADGHVMIVEMRVFNESEFSDLDPSKLDWRTKILLGKEILWHYWDTERGDYSWGNPAEYFNEYIAARFRSRPDRPFNKKYPYNPASDLAYIAKCDADPEHKNKMFEGERYDTLSAFLEGMAEDWEVWT